MTKKEELDLLTKNIKFGINKIRKGIESILKNSGNIFTTKELLEISKIMKDTKYSDGGNTGLSDIYDVICDACNRYAVQNNVEQLNIDFK